MAGFGWAGLWLFVLPADAGLLGCVALPGAVCLGSAVVYFNLPLVDEASRFVLHFLSSKQELDLRWNSVQVGIEAVEGYGKKWYRATRPKERVIKVRVASDSPLGATAPQNGAERPPEAITQQLPALPPPVVYYTTPAQIVVRALAGGRPCSERAAAELGLSRDTFKAAVATLVAAGVVCQAERKPLQLARGFARYTGAPALLDAEVARCLGAREG